MGSSGWHCFRFDNCTTSHGLPWRFPRERELSNRSATRSGEGYFKSLSHVLEPAMNLVCLSTCQQHGTNATKASNVGRTRWKNEQKRDGGHSESVPITTGDHIPSSAQENSRWSVVARDTSRRREYVSAADEPGFQLERNISRTDICASVLRVLSYTSPT